MNTETVRFESLRRRPPVGTQVDLGGLTPIQFKADETGREFADVPVDKAHLLDRIPEGYRRVDADGTPIGGSAAKSENKEEGGKDEKPALLDPNLVVVTEDDNAQDNETDLHSLDDEALRDLFVKKVGRNPSPRAQRPTLIDQIEQAVAAAAAS